MVSSRDNRRRHHRARVKIALNLTRAASTLAEIKGYTMDLSMGGARVVTMDPLEAYSMIHLTLEAAGDAQSVTIESRVLWCRLDPATEESEEKHYISGVQFLNLHTESGKAIVQKLMRRIH